MIHPLLAEVFASQQVTDKFGNSYPLRSSINPEEGEFIWRLISKNKVEHSLEIGCAFDISSLYICAALSKKFHLIMSL